MKKLNMLMKSYFTLTSLLLLSAINSNSQEIKLVSERQNQVAVTNTNKNPQPATKPALGKNYADFSTTAKVLTMEKGAPAVPVYTSSVIVPNEGRTSIEITYESFEEFDNVEVLPSKGSLKRNVDPAKVPYEFGASYGQDAFYPGSLAELGSPFIFRDFRGATITFHPYQYNPVSKKLRIYRNISVNVITDIAEQGVNPKQGNSVPNSAFGPMYESLFLNASSFYDDVEDVGDMLILCPEAYLDIVAPLAEWKVKRGITTTMVPLEDIGDSPYDIKDYISGFYSENPNLAYVLLIGDHAELPCYSYGMTGAMEELWSDSYYAQLEGNDYFPEVLIGRFSGGDDDIITMVDRTLEYETNPAEGDWMTKAAGIGSEEGDGYGDEGQPDWEHLRGIGDLLLLNGYTYINEFYDGSHGINDESNNPEPYMISDAVNQGIGLLNYCGHGAQDIFVTGSFTIDDVNNLENEGKYPFVVSVACNNGTFTQGTSLCESWVRATTQLGFPTGAIAACGSSILMAWAEPMQTQDEIANLIVSDDDLDKKTSLGGLFYNGQISMLEEYGVSPTAVEVMQTWIFFGDPSVVFRSKETLTIEAEHLANIDLDTAYLGISCDVDGAQVTITQNGIIVGTGTVNGGEVVIELGEYDASAPLSVTITQQNHKPYQGTVSVGTMGAGGFNASAFALYPNPAKDFITIKSANEMNSVNVEVRDITGKLIYTVYDASFINNGLTVDTSGYSSGVYILTIENNEGKASKRFVVR